MNNPLELFEKNVRKRLKELGWTQNDLAEKSGIMRAQLNRYLNGKTVPGLDIVGKIAKAMGVSVAVLLTDLDKINSVVLTEALADKISRLDERKRTALFKSIEAIIGSLTE